MMLGIARTLCDMRDKFSGTVKVIFEAGEETQPGGAIGIIESGAVDDFYRHRRLKVPFLPELRFWAVQIQSLGFYEFPVLL